MKPKPSTRRMAPRRIVGLAAGLLLAAIAAAPIPATEEPIDRYKSHLISIFSGDIHVPENVHVTGVVVCVGCDARIEGTVNEVVIIGGTLELSGTVRRQLVTVLSDVKLDHADVSGEVVRVFGSFEETASILRGQFINIGGAWFSSLSSLFFWLRMILLLVAFVLLLLLAAMMPERIRLIGEEAPARYVKAFFVGLLGYLGLLVIVGLLAATIVGLLPAVLGFLIVKWLGIAGIFYIVGRRLGRSLGLEMSLLGAVLLTFAIYAAITLAPSALGFVGLGLSLILRMLFFLAVEVPAVGLVILTRLGSRTQAVPIPPMSAPPPTAPATPAPPAAPAG